MHFIDEGRHDQDMALRVNPALVAPAVKAHVKQILKATVINYRETQAAEAATSGIKDQVNAELP